MHERPTGIFGSLHAINASLKRRALVKVQADSAFALEWLA